MARLKADFSFIGLIAEKHGIAAALIFSRIDWSIDHHRTNNEQQFFFKDRWWMYDTAETFLETFPFFGITTIKKAISALLKDGLLIHCRIRSKNWDQTNFYTIDYAAFEKLKCKNHTVAQKLEYGIDTVASQPSNLEYGKHTLTKKLEYEIRPLKSMKSDLSSLSISPSCSLKKGEGKGEEAAGAAPPPLLNSISEEEKEESIERKIIPIKTSIMAPPNVSNQLAIRWHTRAHKMAPNRRLTISQICTEIEQLRAAGYDYEKQDNILTQLDRSIATYRRKFISPKDGLREHFDRVLVEEAWTEYLHFEKLNPSKELPKKEPDKSVLNVKQRVEQELLENIKRMKEKQI